MKQHPHDTSSYAGNEHAPSLEQILQTIRGVISSEQNGSSTDDTLELTEMLTDDGTIMSTRSPAVETTGKPVGSSASPIHRYADFSSLYADNVSSAEMKPATEDRENLLSEQAAAVSANALKELLHATSTAKNGKEPSPLPPFRSGQTFEEMVQEILRPQLSQWLDRNLPGLIQQLVEKEIQKLLPKQKN